MTKRTVEETLRQELVAAQKAVTAASAAVTRAGEELRKADHAEHDAKVRQDAALDRVARTKAALEGRVRATEQALQVIQLRDGISDETVETLLERPVGR